MDSKCQKLQDEQKEGCLGEKTMMMFGLAFGCDAYTTSRKNACLCERKAPPPKREL